MRDGFLEQWERLYCANLENLYPPEIGVIRALRYSPCNERNSAHAPQTQCIHEEGHSDAESEVGSQEIGSKEAESCRQNGSSHEKAEDDCRRSTACRRTSAACHRERVRPDIASGQAAYAGLSNPTACPPEPRESGVIGQAGQETESALCAACCLAQSADQRDRRVQLDPEHAQLDEASHTTRAISFRRRWCCLRSVPERSCPSQ